MGRHQGPGGTTSGPASEDGAQPRRQRLLALALGITATLVAWGYLVWAAIDFGSKARDGEGMPAWLFLLLATLGATTCLFVTLVLVGKVLATLRGQAPPPRVPGGGKRAAR
ncbi:MAG: hypothetical protein J7518_20885 [Nocardioidaceae bacterium]|nr:hypothetical protein [Nocardioidaceae bacterium]